MVLLKNSNKSLPLNINELTNKKIALIGPTANATKLMQGNYFGTAPYIITPLMGFQLIVQSTSSRYDNNYILINLFYFKTIRLMFNMHWVVKL